MQIEDIILKESTSVADLSIDNGTIIYSRGDDNTKFRILKK